MTAQTAKALTLIGWGFVFNLLDIRIVFFDLLPDFIGYMMIASGLGKLASHAATFERGRRIAVMMIFLSMPHVLMDSNVTFSDFAMVPIGVHLYGQVLLLLHLLLAYSVFNGWIEMAKQLQQETLQESARTRRDWYVFIFMIHLFFYPFLFNLPEDWLLLYLGISFVSIFIELLFIRLPFRFRKLAEASETR